MSIEIQDHSVEGWRALRTEAGFVPDPMILRTGEVFVNGLRAAPRLERPDLDVRAAIRDNIAGLCDFFDLVVTRSRIPLINYDYTFDQELLPRPLASLLGERALPVTVGFAPYEIVKRGAFEALKGVPFAKVQAFGAQLNELDSLRYDWQPTWNGFAGEPSWLADPAALDPDTALAAQFLLGGLIFSGFAQASLTQHYIQPKRARFYLSLTAAPLPAGLVDHAQERSIFDAAIDGLSGTAATVRRLVGLPPILPYLIAKAPPTATAADILKVALDFPATPEGQRYCAAAAVIAGDGVEARQTQDLSDAARKEAVALLSPYSRLADPDGGIDVEFGLGLEGPSVAISKSFQLPAWLRLWWNDHVPFGGIRKTFRRMWMAAESYQSLEDNVLEVWERS